MIRNKKNGFILQIVLIAGAFSLLFYDTIIKMAGDWLIDDNYSHGFLIPIISAYMIWQKKDELARTEIQSNIWGLLIILFGMLLFLAGYLGAELFTKRFSIIVTIIGISYYIFGNRITGKIFIPLLFLVFMVPLPSIIWNKIAFPLQLFASALSSFFIDLTGIPVLREGNILHLPNTILEVVNACSGLRSLTSLLALSAAFAYIVELGTVRKWIIFLSAVPIAIFLNIVRLVLTAHLAHWAGPETAHGFLHDFSGMLVFAVAFILLFLLYRVLSRQAGS